MFYIQIIIDSIKTTWKNKKLWVYGLILSVFSGITLIFNGLTEQDGGSAKQLSAAQSAQINKYWPFITVAFIIFLIIACFIAVLVISAKNGLIFGTNKADKKEKISLKKCWKIGKEKFWKIIGLEIIMAILSAIVYIALNNPLENLYKQKIFALAIRLTILALIIAIPFTILVVFIQIYGYREIILENKGIFKSISNSYNLFVENWKKSILMLLIFSAAIFSISFILGILLIFLSLPVLIFTLVLFAVLQKTGAIIGISVLLVMLLPIILFFASVLYVFKEIVWTKFYNIIKS